MGATSAAADHLDPSPRQDAEGSSSDSGWNRHDLSWTIGLFGTAVGAGILFLPINAGGGGLWPLIAATVLIGPMTYLAHRGLSRFVLASRTPGADITEVAREAFGEGAGKLIAVLYFLSIYPIVLIYGVSITNTVHAFLTEQLKVGAPPRWLLSLLLVTLLMLVMVAGQRIMLIVTQWVVYPLIIILGATSIYMIPKWNLSGLTADQSTGDLLRATWMIIPTMVFAFSFAAATSQFSLAMRDEHGARADHRIGRVMRATVVLLVVFTMGFVWSCVLALGTDGLSAARESNLPVLSYIANISHSPILTWVGPFVAMTAIASSFFGHYLGAHEGAMGVIRGLVDPAGRNLPERTVSWAVTVFIFLTTWLVAILNPSILSLIESLGGPVIAAVLYLLPMLAVHRMPALAPYRGRISNVFVIVAGLVAISAMLYGFLPSS